MKLFSLFPPTFLIPDRRLARSYPFWIVMGLGKVPCGAARYEQERWEFIVARGLANVAGIAGAALAWLLTGLWPIAALAYVVLSMGPFRIKPILRWVEYRGHAVELGAVLVAYPEVDWRSYFHDEVRRTAWGYNDLFLKGGEAGVEKKLTALLPWAERRARKRLSAIQRNKALLG